VKVLVSWLRELVDVPVGIEALAERLHLAGFELASITPLDPVPGPDGPTTGPDAVIDFEITANRPDALSVAGFAREVAALYDVPLRFRPAPLPSGAHPSAVGPLRVTVQEPALCPRFTAALADVTVGPSPAWLAARLTACGVRSINNIVDITNYVLLETGHPIHAYDLARLAQSELRVRRAAPGEPVRTLDGVTRTASADMLVIADAARGQGFGGIMGGGDSEVTGTTTTIAVESAHFTPGQVRRTARRLGLATEASHRFERGADYDAAATALARALELVALIGAGTPRPGWIDAQAQPPAPRPALTLRRGRISRVLGYTIHDATVERILTALGFTLAATHSSGREGGGDGWTVTIPSWRVDVAGESDLIEELARIDGYDRIPEAFPPLELPPPRPAPRLARDARLRTLARAAGFSESVTFSFVARDAARRFATDADIVTIANPLAETMAVMRPTLLAGLVDSVAHNRRREQKDVRLFELATIFRAGAGEHRALALASLGQAAATHWSGSGRAADLYDTTGAIGTLCGALGLEAAFAPGEAAFLTRESATAIAVRPVNGADGVEPRVIGILGEIAPAVAEAHGVPARERVFVAEIDLDLALDWTTRDDSVRAQALPRFPSSSRDVSIVVDATLPATAVRGTIRRAAPPTLVSVEEFDRYQGKGVADGRCSLSLRLVFRAADRTLTDAEVQAAMDAIVAALHAEHDARLRQ
jgi:phenylalanyl-tRNA synthetase beta chain